MEQEKELICSKCNHPHCWKSDCRHPCNAQKGPVSANLGASDTCCCVYQFWLEPDHLKHNDQV